MAKTFDYTKICETILASDPKIRFAGIINERGHLVAGGMKPNLKPLESKKDDEMMFLELALRVKMRKEFDKSLGKVNFAMASRQRALALSILLNNDILYVVSEPDIDYSTLPKKLLFIVNS